MVVPMELEAILEHQLSHAEEIGAFVNNIGPDPPRSSELLQLQLDLLIDSDLTIGSMQQKRIAVDDLFPFGVSKLPGIFAVTTSSRIDGPGNAFVQKTNGTSELLSDLHVPFQVVVFELGSTSARRFSHGILDPIAPGVAVQLELW